MKRSKQIAFGALILLLVFGCRKEPMEKYKRPDWLAGKVFTQIQDSAIFSTFTKCLELTGFDTIINVSGSYTVFAPNDDAFDLFFMQNPEYSSVEQIPLAELSRIVKYHIVQNPWSKDQLRSLDVWGWIDPLDETNDEPKGYKRETLLLDKNLKYGTRYTKEDGVYIVDTLSSQWYRRVVTDARKYAPIFFKDYFDIYNLTLDDYEFYFGRPFEDPNDIYYLNARVIGDEIFAENGFVYNIDRVVQPGQNAYQIITRQYDDKSYSKFAEIVNLFPEFDYNEQETFDQPGADLGLEVDSLFELTFPDLAFNLTREKTKAPPGSSGLPGDVAIRYHHGMIAPTNTALEKLENTYLPGGNTWNGIDGSPLNIKRIIANSHLAFNTIYGTDLTSGFYNGELDEINTVDETSIIHREYASNATFLGVDEAIVPRAFSSVTGPIYLRRGYAKIMYAIEESGLLPALKRKREPGEQYLLFVESDQNTSADSSFLYDKINEEFYCFTTSGSSARKYGITKNDLRTLLLNHIAVREPTGVADLEFIPNLAGNYLIFNNLTGEVRGTSGTTVGYRGSTPSVVIPQRIDTDADNGSTYDIDDWFTFSTTTLYLRIYTLFREFFDLIESAGMTNSTVNEFTFISESENYTVFAPSAEALAAQQARIDTLDQEELEAFILSHFVRKTMMFTDGSSEEGFYEILRPHETSTPTNKVLSKIYIEPGYDEIVFPAASGGSFHTISLSDSTNYLCGQTLSGGQVTIPVLINTAVIHKTNRALIYDELETYQPSR